MTPLSRLIARWSPALLAVPTLTLVYATMLVCILLASRHQATRIIYVDVRGDR